MGSMMNDLGIYPEVIAKTDSTAAKGMVGRRGLGKTRHVDVCYLWLQDMATKEEVSVAKIPGDINPADLMTKYLSGERTGKLMQDMGLIETEGRHELTPKCAVDEGEVERTRIRRRRRIRRGRRGRIRSRRKKGRTI